MRARLHLHVYSLSHRLLGALGAFATAWLACGPVSAVQDQSALPVPLTLDFAIATGTQGTHPALLAAQAQRGVAEAELEYAQSSYALESSLSLTAGWVQPNELALDQTHDDHIAQLNLRKVLYDFGVTGGRVNAAENLISASQFEYQYAQKIQVINIARHFFEVLLTDLKYAWDNENMAMHYVEFDKIRERHRLQQVSDIELLRSENLYLSARTQRNASETMQRTSRALLAIAINRPSDLAADLERPSLNAISRSLPELDELIAAAVGKILEMRARRNRASAALQQLEAARKRIRPTLDATFQFSEYSRLTPNRDDARARLNLVIPLNEHGLQRREVAETRAEWLQASAAVQQLEVTLRSKVAELWQQLNRLQIKQQELDVAEQRSELELDRARGEYELEMITDLGDAMVDTSRVKYERAKNDFEQALAWMNLYLLIGENPEKILKHDGA